MSKIDLYVILSLLGLAFPGLAQNPYAINSQFYYGTIYEHNKKFKPEVDGPSVAFEFGFYKKYLGEKAWQQKLKFPHIGASYIYARYSNPEIFGRSHSILPHIEIQTHPEKKLHFGFRFGYGLAFLTKSFDLKDNPNNNVIGSKINSIVQYRFGLNYEPNNRICLHSGISMTHWSSARAQVPNLGINLFSFQTSMAYQLQALSEHEYSAFEHFKAKRKNSLQLYSGLGIYETGVSGGPKYPVYIQNIQYNRYTSIVNKLLIGSSLEYNQGVYDWIQHQEIGEHKNQALLASSFSLYIGDEVLFGSEKHKVGFSGLVGFYLNKAQLRAAPLYAKLAVQYYPYALGNNLRYKPFVKVGMKSHYATADYPEMGLGLEF